MYIGTVNTFQGVQPTKEQAVKVLEEAAETFGAWQIWHDDNCSHYERETLLEECADVIQATCNLAAAVCGSSIDFRTYINACEQRNMKRGRVYDLP